jgi:rhamnogalacturonan endolyase
MYSRNFKLFLFCLTSWFCIQCTPQKQTNSAEIPQGTRLIFEDDFDQPLDTSLWKVELQESPGSTVKSENGNLVLQTGAGVTIWLNRMLRGNLLIIYERSVILQNGSFDRLSDFNQFWMAKDPRNPSLFTRKGKLDEYDSLLMYYVGMGGNSNSTTRFRKYDGLGNRQLIGEHKDKAHLLLPNHIYRVKISVNKGLVEYWMDGELYFSYPDPSPLTSGYFGFRSTKSHQQIHNIKIYQLK